MSRLTSFLLGAAAFILTLLLIVGVQDAFGQTYITVPGASYHGDRSREWTEANPGIGIEHKYGTLGYYRNSYGRDTFYLGWVWRPIELGRYVQAGAMVALATGYDSPVIAAPTVSIGGERVKVDLIAGPAIGKDTTWFVGAQLRLLVE